MLLHFQKCGVDSHRTETLPKNSRRGRQDASRKRSKGAFSGGEITAYADLGARAFPGADLVEVSS